MPARWKRFVGVLLWSGTISSGVARSAAVSPAPSADLSPQSFRLPTGFSLDVVASEPLVARPVAIDWGADGRLWVVEINEGPASAGDARGLLGRVTVLSDPDRDGRYDEAAPFLEDLLCPSGVLAWGRGALICAAPDLIYAEDTDGDGHADLAQRLWVGFDTENPVLRLNSLSLGLDNWIHGASGSRGGVVRTMARLDPAPLPPASEVIPLAGHDFRLKPDTGAFEPVSGLAAFARTRDDWDHWFGCDAEGSVWQYPLPHRYRRRNPHVALPDDAVPLFKAGGSSDQAGRAAGFCVNRGEGLAVDWVGSGFLCEPERGLVRRLTLTRPGIPFAAQEAPGPDPFLSSSDPAFAPVQVRMGPDGALWIVDRNRSPAPLPSSSLPAAGAGARQRAGRILRLHPEGSPTRAIRDLTRMPVAELVEAFDSASGAERDRVHTHLLHRHDPGAALPLRQLARQSPRPACRAQALCVLDGLGGLRPPDLEAALRDPHPGVRAQALRLSEPFLRRTNNSDPGPLGTALLRLGADPDKSVRYQLALTLGEWADPRAGRMLGGLAVAELADPWIRAAVLSAASHFPDEILKAVLPVASPPVSLAAFIDSLAVTAASTSDEQVLEQFVDLLNRRTSAANEALAMSGLGRLLEILRDRSAKPDTVGRAAISRWKQSVAGGAALLQRARTLARDGSAFEEARLAAVGLLGQTPNPPEDDLDFLSQLLIGSDSTRMKETALNALVATHDRRVADLLLKRWSRQPPSLRRAMMGPLVARPEWATRLLEAVKVGIVATTEVTPINRERLLTDADSRIREQAGAVFAARLPDRRHETLLQFAPALSLTGDASKGRVTFENLCSRCHAAGNVGVNVGPDLSGLSSRTTPELLESILDPTATIEPRFVSYQIETEDERSLSGVVTVEDGAQLTLVQSGGKPEVVALKTITDLRASDLSLMPEGLEQGQTAQDLADLLAFIRSLAR